MTTGAGDTRPDDADRPTDPELDALMERLRTLGRIDDPPPLVDTLARAAFETRDLDAELAQLTTDSAVDQLALVRTAATTPRMLSFETAAVGIDLEIDHADDAVTVRGLVTGVDPDASGLTLMLDTADRRIPLSLDPHGWFRAADVPIGVLRVRLSVPGAAAVVTPGVSTRPD